MKGRRKTCRFRFSLSTLLLLTATLAGWLALHVNAARDQRSAVAKIHDLRGKVRYRHQLDDDGLFFQDSVPPGSARLRRLVGNDYFFDVVFVDLQGPFVTDADLSVLNSLPDVQYLILRDTQISNEGMTSVGTLRDLRSLDIQGTNVTTGCLAQVTNLRELRWLRLSGAKIRDSDLMYLRPLTKLTMLTLFGSDITDAGLANLKSLKDLETLAISDTNVTDVGLVHLYGLTKLRSLSVENSGVTDEGVRELMNALPNCSVYTGDVAKVDEQREHGVTHFGELNGDWN